MYQHDIQPKFLQDFFYYYEIENKVRKWLLNYINNTYIKTHRFL